MVARNIDGRTGLMREKISFLSEEADWTMAGVLSFAIDSAEGDLLLRENGWSLEGTPLIGALTAHAVLVDRFSVIELTALPTIYHLQSLERQEDQVLVYIVREGTGVVEIDGRRSTFTPGDVIVIPRMSKVVFTFEEVTVMAHIRTAWSRFMGPQVRAVPIDRPFAGDPVFLELLFGLHQSVLRSNVLLGDCGLVHTRRSLEASLDAVFAAEVDRQLLEGGSRTQDLYRQATIVIENSYDNMKTTPDSVARGLGVTRKHLEAVFRELGDTVGTYLRRARATHAQRLLHDREDGIPLKVKDIALRTGFASVSSMRRAIKDVERLELR